MPCVHSPTYSLSAWVRRAQSCLSGWLNSYLFLLVQAMLQWQEKPRGCIRTLLPSPNRVLNPWSFICPEFVKLYPSSPQHEAGDGRSFLCQGKSKYILRKLGGLCHLRKTEPFFQPMCKTRPFWEGSGSSPPLLQPIKAFPLRILGMRPNQNLWRLWKLKFKIEAAWGKTDWEGSEGDHENGKGLLVEQGGSPGGEEGPGTELRQCVTEAVHDCPKSCFRLLDVFLEWVGESEPAGLAVCEGFM